MVGWGWGGVGVGGGTDGGYSITTEMEGIKAGVRTSAEVSRRSSGGEEGLRGSF